MPLGKAGNDVDFNGFRWNGREGGELAKEPDSANRGILNDAVIFKRIECCRLLVHSELYT